jgi:hypothetical protein
MRFGIFLSALAVVASGCTAAMLDRQTVNQTISITDMRYQEVMDNLAVVAHNTGTLPSFALNGGGVSQVTNLVSVEPKTTWDPVGFISQALNVAGKHNPQVQWNFEAATSNVQLAALRYACIWAGCGPEYVDPDGIEYLRAPKRSDIFPTPTCTDTWPPCDAPSPPPAIPHFDVMNRLQQLPPHWLKCGSCRDVDRCACYKAHCCGKYVWVNPPDLKALSDFTLVVLDIATRDPMSLASSPASAQVVVCGDPTAPDPFDPSAPLAPCKCSSDCICAYDPVAPCKKMTPSGEIDVKDCTMPIQDCKGGMSDPNLQVTETWKVFQADSLLCKDLASHGEVPQISCGNYVVYSGDFVVTLPYICKARPAGSPCPQKVPTHHTGPYSTYPSVNPPQSYGAPQFEPPAPYGSHAPQPSYPR